MVSLRLDGGVAAALRAYARETGRSLSDILREAATNYIREVQAAHSVTLHYTVTNRTRSASDDPWEFETVLLAEIA
jgi:predicted DNA-binding protein